MSSYKENPEVTVLMPVRNGERYIKEAIDSILKQTFTDFELLIMDDGSTDATIEIIQSYKDERICLKRKEHDFIANLNEGLKLSAGTYIARMDADDIMHTERLRIQVKRMKQNPDITVCGTWAKIFSDEGGRKAVSHMGYDIVCYPIIELLRRNVLIHPSVMIKKEFLIQHGIEYQNYPCVEDYKLWFDIAKAGGTLFIEPQELLMFRQSNTQITVTQKEQMHSESIFLRKEILRHLLSIQNDENLDHLFANFEYLENNKWISAEDTFLFFADLFKRLQ